LNWISDISLWWIFPWSILAIFLSILLYKKKGWVIELTKFQRILLISLRALSLILLFLLILGVLFEYKSYRNEKPVVITVIDNSSSILNYKDSNDVKLKLSDFQANLKEKLGSRFDYYAVNLFNDSTGKLNFNGEETNISAVLDRLHSDFYNRNIGAVTLISDGNYNKGINPLYVAEKFNVTPFFTVGVGDTVPKRDQYIKAVSSNDFAFLKNDFPVEVEVEAIKMGVRSANVSLLKNGKVIANQSISYNDPNYSFKQINFTLPADQVGIQRYTANLIVVDGEYNTKNNSRDFYIEILDARSKVLLLAGAPHPDVAALKSVIEKDENLTVQSVLTKDWDNNTKDIDLVIWHEPGWQTNNTALQTILAKKLPVLYIVGVSSTANDIARLGLGLKTPGGNQTDDIEAKYNSGFVPFEISDELKDFFNYLPPLKSKFGNVNWPAGIDVMLYQRIGNIQKKDPMLFFGKQNGVKYGVLYGEGLWRWKINDYSRNGSFEYFNEFIQKITQYLVVRQNSSPFIVSLPKRISKSEEFIVKAEFYNEAMDLITTPVVNFELKNEAGIVNKFEFGQSGNAYRLNCGRLQPGKYDWKANTKFNGKAYYKSGSFIVEDIVIEDLDNQADHQVLRQIASQTNGKFFKLSQLDQLYEDLNKRDDLVNISYAESTFIDLIDWKLLFFLLLIALVAEWSLRRFFGGY
jgi:hypothetical protein|tara:strand:- start:6513 stop:8588 length:2076 start_codon:yes stop_codon:yes gene_type:complete